MKCSAYNATHIAVMQNNIITIFLGHHELQLHFNVAVNNTWPCERLQVKSAVMFSLALWLN